MPHNTRQKFNIFRKYVCNFHFISSLKKQCLEQIFYLSQKYYYCISRFAYKYKLKRTKYYHHRYDLNLNPLKDLSEKLLIKIWTIL